MWKLRIKEKNLLLSMSLKGKKCIWRSLIYIFDGWDLKKKADIDGWDRKALLIFWRVKQLKKNESCLLRNSLFNPELERFILLLNSWTCSLFYDAYSVCIICLLWAYFAPKKKGVKAGGGHQINIIYNNQIQHHAF